MELLVGDPTGGTVDCVFLLDTIPMTLYRTPANVILQSSHHHIQATALTSWQPNTGTYMPPKPPEMLPNNDDTDCDRVTLMTSV